jgi:glutamate formiminotransferase/glutamate formiminotransferase/formiminotetrahydrofolate cyclodeaminase
MTPPILLAVPNVSEGRGERTIAAIAAAFLDGANDVRVLDVHSDPDHHRSVFTIAGRPQELIDALVRGARVAVERIDVMSRGGRGSAEAGLHPHVGALDVAPIVYVEPADRGAACATALVVGDRLGEELQLPVFLYGELSGSDPASARNRAQLRRGGVAELAARLATREEGLAPDFGPARMHPSAGATLVAARPPLVAFNLQLASPATVSDARAIAGQIREGGRDGLPGLRALGLALSGEVVQVSMNVEQPFELPLAKVIEAVRAHAHVSSAELVGLAPAAAFEGFPQDLPMPGFDPQRHLIENALGC